MENKIKLFENKVVRSHWDAEQEEWYFSVVDVCWILADSIDFTTARKYWNKLKQRLKAEGSQLVTDCHQLKLPASDGKYYATDVLNFDLSNQFLLQKQSLLKYGWHNIYCIAFRYTIDYTLK